MIVTCPKGHQFYYSEEQIGKKFVGPKTPTNLGIPLGEQHLGEANYDGEKETSLLITKRRNERLKRTKDQEQINDNY